jgi:hypothetical protein
MIQRLNLFTTLQYQKDQANVPAISFFSKRFAIMEPKAIKDRNRRSVSLSSSFFIEGEKRVIRQHLE